MKPIPFPDMPYARPDKEAVEAELAALAERLASAAAYPEAKAAFLSFQETMKHLMSLLSLATIRHSIDTRDAFYDAEIRYLDAAMPEIEAYHQRFVAAMLASPFRPDFEREYGSLYFLNAEMAQKAFSPEIIPELQRDNELSQAYENLIASAQIPFEGKVCTLSQLSPFKRDPDDARRLAAWKAEGQWFRDRRSEFDGLYDELVRLRDRMGRKLGYGGFTELGYLKMSRNCYGRKDVEAFRAAVVRHLVPVADGICRAQAKRLGTPYPMSFADNALLFRSGNPKPCGGPEDILAHGRRFYDELSPETGTFFRMMTDNRLLDVLSTEGKQAGGYCTAIPDYESPFIFANFNGTRDDVETVTHEAGHAFACYLNINRVPAEYVWPSMESCEVHSMSMEFFAWPWAEGFFGPDTRKFRYCHLAGALTFIPYGTMVDHFQHEVYDHPDMTPADRHAVWKRLLGVYMPWLRLDGDIPFYADGEGWQRQLHIYTSPFYYIDYCLAQTVALEFWAMILHDLPSAWDRYMAYARQGGSRTFTDLLKHAGLDSPFDETCLRRVCGEAQRWLETYDLSGIE